jgi:GNAT superfamily N-acetyltransferase
MGSSFENSDQLSFEEHKMPRNIKVEANLKKDYHVRPATMDDLEALHSLLMGYWETLTGAVKFTLEDFSSIFSTPGFEMTSSTRVVLTPQGEMVGAVLVMDLASPPVHPVIYGCVHDDHEGQGLGTFLVQWGEQRARLAINRVPDGARVAMRLQTTPTHQPTVQLFEKLGIKPVRYSWFMLRELDEKPPDPQWPGGIQVSSFQEFPHLETIYRAVNEAFQDHWGYVDPEDIDERLERMRHTIENDESFDASLWFIVLDSDEIAGGALCSPRLGEDWEIGIVETLGVRRPWRRQGLGLALLHQAFGEFHQRGKARVGLSVDSENLTGATRLYEKAGMQVVREFVLYEKELRPGEELSKG